MDRSGPWPAVVSRRVVEHVSPGATAVGGRPGVGTRLLEPEQVDQDRGGRRTVDRPGPDRVEAPNRMFGGHLGMERDQVGIRPVVDDQLVGEPLRVGEQESVALARGLDPGRLEPVPPPGDRVRRADPPDDSVDHPGAGHSRGGTGVLEEGQVEARAALLVAVEQVVDGGIVLIDRLLDQPHP